MTTSTLMTATDLERMPDDAHRYDLIKEYSSGCHRPGDRIW